MYIKTNCFKYDNVYKQYSLLPILYNNKKNKYLRLLTAFFILISLLINLKYLLKNNVNIFNLLKNSDYFSLYISIQKYSKIINFLSKKFFIKNRTIKKIKKKISISNVDFLDGVDNTYYFIDMLKEDFIIDFNNTYPDYLFYDVFGCEHLSSRYNNSIKIAYYSENIIYIMCEKSLRTIGKKLYMAPFEAKKKKNKNHQN